MSIIAAELIAKFGAEGMDEVDKATDSMQKKVERTAGDFLKAGGVLTGFGLGVTKVFKSVIGTSADFEYQMSATQSVLGATKEEFKLLEAEALRLGSTTALSATEAGAAMEIMAKAGVPLHDILNGAAEDAINLAFATGEDLTLAAETAATAMNTLGVTSEVAADIIAQSANASALGVNDWALALKTTGPIAASLNVSMEDLAATMMILADTGIKGEVAATSMRNILMGLADTTNEGTKALDALGISTYDASGNFRGLEAITTDLAGSWKNMNQEQRMTLAQQVSGKDGAASFMAIMDAQVDSIDRGTNAFEERKKAMAGVGTAEAQALTRMDNFNGVLEEFKGAVETGVIIVGGFFLPVLQDLVGVATDVVAWFLQLPEGVQKTLAGIVGLAGGTSLLVGGFLILKGLLMALAPGFLAVIGPALLVVAAVTAIGAGAYFAYQKFEPFRNAVNKSVSSVKDFGKYLRTDGVDRLKDLAAKVTPLAKELGGTLVDGFSKVISIAKTLAPIVGGVLASGFDTLKSAVSAVWNVLSSAFGGTVVGLIQNTKDLVLSLIQPFIDVKDAIASAFKGDWSGAFSSLQDAVESVLTAIVNIFTFGFENIVTILANTNWGALWEGLKTAGIAAFNAVKNAVRDINWTGLLSGAWSAIKMSLEMAWGTIKSIDWFAVIGKPVEVGLKLYNWTKTLLGSIQWSSIIGGLFDIATNFFSWTKEQIGSIAWLDLFGEAIDLGERFLKWLGENIDLPQFEWPSISQIKDWIIEWVTGSFSDKGRAADDNNYNTTIGAPSTTNASGVTRTPYQRYTDSQGTKIDASTGLASNPNWFRDQNLGAQLGQLVNLKTLFEGVRQAADLYNESQARVGVQSTVSFGQVGAASTTNIAPLGAMFGNVALEVTNTWNRSFAAMAVSTNGYTSQMNSYATTNTAAANKNVSANMLAMQLGVATQMAAIAASTNTQMTTASGYVTTQSSSMSASLAGKLTGMALNTSVQLALAAGHANTQMTSMATYVETGAASASLKLGTESAKWSTIVTGSGNSAVNAARTVGLLVGEGLAAGMRSALGSVTNAANSLIAQVDRAMRAKAQIHSPSRMTKTIGSFMGEGLVEGLEDAIYDVSKAGYRLSEAAMPRPQNGVPSSRQFSSSSSRGAQSDGQTVYHIGTVEVTIDAKELQEVTTMADFFHQLPLEAELTKTA